MTAKEKALKLCQDFGYLGLESKQTEYYTLDLELAKRCALVCINEIMNGNFAEGYDHEFWTNVKIEVQKL